MIGKTLSLNTANIRLSNKTNKQKQYFFATKTNFFQLRKIFTRECIKHASGTHRKPTLFACLHSSKTHKPKRENRRGWRIISINKIRGAGFVENHFNI